MFSFYSSSHSIYERKRPLSVIKQIQRPWIRKKSNRIVRVNCEPFGMSKYYFHDFHECNKYANEKFVAFEFFLSFSNQIDENWSEELTLYRRQYSKKCFSPFSLSGIHMFQFQFQFPPKRSTVWSLSWLFLLLSFLIFALFLSALLVSIVFKQKIQFDASMCRDSRQIPLLGVNAFLCRFSFHFFSFLIWFVRFWFLFGDLALHFFNIHCFVARSWKTELWVEKRK